MRVLHCYNTLMFNIFFGFCPQAWRVRTGLSSGNLVWWNFFHFRFKNSRIWFKFGFSESCHGNRQLGHQQTSTVIERLKFNFFWTRSFKFRFEKTTKILEILIFLFSWLNITQFVIILKLLEQERAIIFFRGQHCVFFCVSRPKNQ